LIRLALVALWSNAMFYSSNPYFGGFPYALESILQEMTPIVIDYKPSMLDAADQPVYHRQRNRKKPKYTFRISPPRIVKRGVTQYLSDSLYVPIPEDGIVRFKLPPSNLYFPRGRYIVEIFRSGCQIPIDTQRWLVPAIPKQLNYTFTYDELQPTPILPLYVWQINSVSPAAEFAANYNSLMWISENVPAFGTTITATYTPAVTLDQLHEYTLKNLEGVSRTRY
jgi:hypothetical protein